MPSRFAQTNQMVQLTQSDSYTGTISIVNIPQPFKQTNDSKMPIS